MHLIVIYRFHNTLLMRCLDAAEFFVDNLWTSGLVEYVSRNTHNLLLGFIKSRAFV